MCNSEIDELINPDQLLGRKKWRRPMAFVPGDQFSRANLLPVNHPRLSSVPPALPLALMDLHWLAQC